jgi:glucokinase
VRSRLLAVIPMLAVARADMHAMIRDIGVGEAVRGVGAVTKSQHRRRCHHAKRGKHGKDHRHVQAKPGAKRLEHQPSLDAGAGTGKLASARKTRYQRLDMPNSHTSSPALVADIGGTNARFALVDLDSLELLDVKQYPCAGHQGIADVAQAYLKGLKEPPRQAALAVAGPVTGEEIRITNSGWTFTAEELCRVAGLDDVLILNDFHALAVSLPLLRANELQPLGGGEPVPHAAKVVLGPGTGVGVAGLVWSGSGWIAVPGEGGHITLSAHSPREFEMIERLRAGRDHLSADRVLSGPGLVSLYRAIAESHGRTPEPLQPNDVLIRGLAESDPIAVEALAMLVAWLGGFAGDAALLFGARGGVYVAGAIGRKIARVLSAGGFRRAFEAKGRMRSYLAPIPAYLILPEFAALRGAAEALRAKLANA